MHIAQGRILPPIILTTPARTQQSSTSQMLNGRRSCPTVYIKSPVKKTPNARLPGSSGSTMVSAHITALSVAMRSSSLMRNSPVCADGRASMKRSVQTVSSTRTIVRTACIGPKCYAEDVTVTSGTSSMMVLRQPTSGFVLILSCWILSRGEANFTFSMSTTSMLLKIKLN